MNKKILSLEERTLTLIDDFSHKADEFIDRITEEFTDYLLGEIIDPHPDMLQMINTSGLTAEDTQRVKDYAFLENVRNSSERIAGEFVEAYFENRYNPGYTLENFLLSWNREDKKFLNGEEEFGDYGAIISGIYDLLERNNELSGFMYGFDDEYLEGIKGFRKMGIVSTSVNNAGILYELFLGTLGEDIKQSVEEIVYNKRLANEAANTFLDQFPNFRNNRNFSIGNFLRYFDVEKKSFSTRRKTNTGSYSSLYDRIHRESGNDWENAFYEKLDDPLQTRVKNLSSEIGTKGIIEEDKIQLVEYLVSGDLLKYLDMFADEGSDAEDIFLAMNIDKVSGEELGVLADVAKDGRSSIRKYLGQCRFQLSDSAIQYDWRHNLMKISESIDPVKFEGNLVLSSILVDKSIQSYRDRYKKDKPGTIESIRLDINEAANPVYSMILRKTLDHYELRLKIGHVSGFKSRLMEVT
jgi:hypothetical protein